MRTTESVAERRRHIGEAVWRVIRRDGIDAVSARSIAAEAGMALGSLRHYFPRQADVVEFAMRLVIERTTARIRIIAGRADRDEDVSKVHDDDAGALLLLEQFLPFDDERRAEVEVWLTFSGAALTDSSLVPVKREFDAVLLDHIRHIVDVRSAADVTPDERRFKASRLHALVDGLAAHLVGPFPPVTPTEARAILAAEIRGASQTL
jgi:AcrR family transcriptional regulator